MSLSKFLLPYIGVYHHLLKHFQDAETFYVEFHQMLIHNEKPSYFVLIYFRDGHVEIFKKAIFITVTITANLNTNYNDCWQHLEILTFVHFSGDSLSVLSNSYCKVNGVLKENNRNSVLESCYNK